MENEIDEKAHQKSILCAVFGSNLGPKPRSQIVKNRVFLPGGPRAKKCSPRRSRGKMKPKGVPKLCNDLYWNLKNECFASTGAWFLQNRILSKNELPKPLFWESESQKIGKIRKTREKTWKYPYWSEVTRWVAEQKRKKVTGSHAKRRVLKIRVWAGLDEVRGVLRLGKTKLSWASARLPHSILWTFHTTTSRQTLLIYISISFWLWRPFRAYSVLRVPADSFS